MEEKEKEMEKNNELLTTPPPPKRQSIKSQSHFNTYPLWKNKLRENCYKRVREDRNRLLWKMRLPSSKSINDKDFMKSAFQDIFSDELEKMKCESLDDDLMPISTPHSIDILWEYDGVHDAYEGDREEMLLEMQRIFYEDLRDEPGRKESENHIQIWEDELDEYLAQAVFENLQLNDKQVRKETWCPICKQGQLQENHQLIYCSLCKLQLSKGDEVNLETLETRLAEVHTEHLDRGCKVKPKFCLETRFGLTALYISCEVCRILEIVM
ncbi:uncharacterized protein LOC126654743 isoform X2 [Mercurialis annua]|uniref:uncharacterized protein LOC126654743 isoform X2 n=1 Tax=Mercurialis annua TaxID=3986 RepID=UPI00215FF98C|nr:uncharacterized protein LOC126654743 isoform X2 [Mercurialis annua]